MSTLAKTTVACAVLTVFSGCAGYLTAKKRIESPLPVHSRVAVLPFENLTGMEKAGEKVTDYFQTAMSGYRQFETVEYGTVYEALRRYRIRSSSLLTNDQIDSLAMNLGVEYILTGSVIEYEEHDNMYLGRVPQVAFNCRVIDCSTKKTVWVATSSGSGDKGELVFGIGAVRSADDLARQMVQEAVNNISRLFGK